MKHYIHLSIEERENIFLGLASWKTQKQIADELGRNPSTLSRELGRNSTVLPRKIHPHLNPLREKQKENFHYLPDTADKKSENRRKEVNWRAPLKRPEIFSYTIEKLKDGWSPDIIAGNLKLLYPVDTSMHISHECIYQFIYTKHGKELHLRKYLLRSHKKRKKQIGRSTRKLSKIPNRVGIEKRKIDYPLCEIRNEFGHFEWDSILSMRTTYSALRTEVERMSRFIFSKKIRRKSAEYTKDATLSIFSYLPVWSVKSTTWDNGREHTLHEQVTKELGIPIYFADPYKSWQRWSNEHGNGMIRRFFPKWTNFDEISEAELQKVVDVINNRPRKILWYQTPKQVFDTYLSTFL